MKGERNKDFSYKDLKKVYTIVIYEKSAEIFHRKKEYLHYGRTYFNTGLELELLQEFCLVALDVFQKNSYHKERGELAGWLSLLATEDLGDAEENIRLFPWLEEIYREMAGYRKQPEEVMNMWSEALAIMDRNMMQYMIDEQQKEIEEKNATITEQAEEIEEKAAAIAEKDAEIARLRAQLEGKQ